MELTLKQQYINSLSHTANNMLVDTLVTLGARASAGMVLNPKPGILSPASDELIFHSFKFQNVDFFFFFLNVDSSGI